MSAENVDIRLHSFIDLVQQRRAEEEMLDELESCVIIAREIVAERDDWKKKYEELKAEYEGQQKLAIVKNEERKPVAYLGYDEDGYMLYQNQPKRYDDNSLDCNYGDVENVDFGRDMPVSIGMMQYVPLYAGDTVTV